MKAVTINSYIYLGQLHWHLAQLSGTVDAKGEKGAVTAIQKFKKELEKTGLPVTLRAGWQLWKLGEEIEKDPEAATIPSEKSKEISEIAYQLENTLMAEAQGKIAYLITDKRLDTEKLIHNQSALLAPEVWDSLPFVCVADFSGACEAIAYELPTAAAFHILRCTEGVLRHLYLEVIKRKRLEPKLRTWGAMVLQIRNKKSNSLSTELLDTLDRIRVNFRNPTNHPEKIFDIEEAQDLLGLCVDAINRMVKADQWILPEDSFKNYKLEYSEEERKAKEENMEKNDA